MIRESMWPAVCAGVLALVLLVQSIRLWIVRRELRRMAGELRRNRDAGYNRRVTVTLADSALTELAGAVNEGLDYQQQLKEESTRAEQRLKASVSDIAHDLRTPLTVIKGSLQLLDTEVQTQPRAREYVRVCMEKTDRMKQMADDFFELSLLESEPAVLARQELDAGSLLMEFLAGHEGVIRARALEPELIQPPKNVRLHADPQLVQRVLENLLNNVLKYAAERFTVALVPKENCCRISFCNRAPGLTDADCARLFERCYRADRARRGGGAGLGLYIVRLLMEQQGGTVSAELDAEILRIHADFPY